jgi:single-strand DNA-binding protein
MASLNKVFLIGNLTRDPELRYTPSGAAVTDLGLAVNRQYTTREGERRDETLFVDITVWNRQAETCCQYLKKGRPIHVEGFLRMDSWEDKNTGEKRTKVRVEADRVQFLDSRRDGGPSDSGSELDEMNAPPQARDSYRRDTPARSAPRNDSADSRPAPARRAPAPPPADPGDDDDIPF